MAKLTVLNHPLFKIKITKPRDKKTPPHDFKRVLHEVASFMSNSVFAHLNNQSISVETPLEVTNKWILRDPFPCLILILQAGNGLTDAF